MAALALGAHFSFYVAVVLKNRNHKKHHPTLLLATWLSTTHHHIYVVFPLQWHGIGKLKQSHEKNANHCATNHVCVCASYLQNQSWTTKKHTQITTILPTYRDYSIKNCFKIKNPEKQMTTADAYHCRANSHMNINKCAFPGTLWRRHELNSRATQLKQANWTIDVLHS